MKWSLSAKLERKVTNFLQELDLLNLGFFQGMEDYIGNRPEEFLRRKEEVQDRESRLDELRRTIEFELFSKMLIPESRADILELLEQLDAIAGLEERLIMQFYAEKPRFPEELKIPWENLRTSCSKALEAVLETAGAFFQGESGLLPRIKRVSYFEKEADGREEQCKVILFSLENLDLAGKLHLRWFIEKMSLLSDQAEDIADRIGIYRVKREI